MQACRLVQDILHNNINRCDICYFQYDLKQKQPIIICQRHTICRKCLNSIPTPKKCPFCRALIDQNKIAVNQSIYELLAPGHPQGRKIQLVEIEAKVFLPLRPSPFLRSIKLQSFYSLFLMMAVESLFNLTFNLYFAVKGSGYECYDDSDHIGGLVLRHWLFAFAMVQAALLVLGLIELCVWGYFGSNCSYSMVSTCILLVLKTFVWAFVEILLFYTVINQSCSGGIQTYGTLQTSINVFWLFIGFIVVYLGCLIDRKLLI